MTASDIVFCVMSGAAGMTFIHLVSVGERRSLPRTIFGGILYAVALLVGEFISSPLTEQLFCTAALLLTVFLLHRERMHRAFAFSVTVQYSLLISETAVKHTVISIMGADYFGSYNGSVVSRIFIDLAVCGLFALVLLVIYRLFTEQHPEVSRLLWMNYSFVAGVFLLTVAAFGEVCPYDGSRWEYSVAAAVISLLFLVMSLMVVNFFVEICSAYHRERRMFMLRSDYYSVKEQLEVQYQTSARLRKIRHDIKNHLISATSLIDKGEADKARELLREISDSADKLQPALAQSTGNSLIDSIITYKSAVSEMRGIRFEYSLEPLPELGIELADISSVVSNLLDNALEAAGRCSSPQIEVRIFVYKEYLSVIVRNTFYQLKREQTGRLLSDKDDRDSHGLGMEIIRETCERNGGVYRYSANGAWFTANALMKISKPQ